MHFSNVDGGFVITSFVIIYSRTTGVPLVVFLSFITSHHVAANNRVHTCNKVHVDPM